MSKQDVMLSGAIFVGVLNGNDEVYVFAPSEGGTVRHFSGVGTLCSWLNERKRPRVSLHFNQVPDDDCVTCDGHMVQPMRRLSSDEISQYANIVTEKACRRKQQQMSAVV